MNPGIVALVTIIAGLLLLVFGVALLKGALKVGDISRGNLVKVYFWTSTGLALTSAIAFFYPKIREKVEEKKASANRTR